MNDSIECLNTALAAEVQAICRYYVNSKICKNLGLYVIAKKMNAAAAEEISHADILTERIVDLGGMPEVNINTKDMTCIKDIKEIFIKDLEVEKRACNFLSLAIVKIETNGDFITSAIFRNILSSESEHVSWISEQLNAIELMGKNAYLSRNG